MSYNIRGSYINERNKALYRSNDYNENVSNEDYAYGNSFQVVYDDMKTVSFSGDLKANFSDDVTLASAELLVVIQMMCNKKPGIYQRLN
jgi:hypothetical protein